MGDAGAHALAGMLTHNRYVRSLDLVNTGITADGLRALLGALTDRPESVERLFLGGNGLGPDSAEVLAALLRDAGVRELYVHANHLGDEGATVLAAATDPARPVTLGLGGNGIGPAGARALADALDGIESLDLGRVPSERALGARPNTPGDEGLAAIAAALPGSALRRLEVRHTGISHQGVATVLGAVVQGGLLEYAGFGPGIPRRTERAVRRHLRPAQGAHHDVRMIGSLYR